MLAAGYIGEFEFVDNHRSGKIVVELNGRWVEVNLRNDSQIAVPRSCAVAQVLLMAVGEV